MRRFIPTPLQSLYHWLWALGSAIVFGFPSRKLIVIGVTGTKGKTTVTELLTNILETSGKKVAVANGLHFKIGDRETPNLLKMTMPGHGKLQKFLWKAQKAGCRYAILEVTSEGILQYRQKFIRFATAALTNLQKEHIEAHGSFEAYRAAKGKFFRDVRTTHVINANDPNAEYFKRFPAKRKIFYTSTDAERLNLKPRLLGAFNLMNAICAATIADALGIPAETIRKAVSTFEGVPGRMEFVRKDPFAIIVDYAHTPDSLEAVYQTARESLTPTRVICVLGAAGGGRDKWKRPVMGAIAARHCDEIILTNEDPYDEDPNQILIEIKSGIPNDKIQMIKIVLDRKDAIEKAITRAKPGDAVMITGKGAEKWMMLEKGKRIPWSDAKIARDAIG